MSHFMLIFLTFFAFFQNVTPVVNINTLGDQYNGDNCIKDSLPDVEFSTLSESDEARVTDLKFLMGLYRHGIRHPSRIYEEIITPPPNGTWSFRCNTRNLLGNVDANASPKSRLGLTFDVFFSDDEERYLDSNCEWTQIADDTPDEMRLLANKFVDRYYRKNSRQAFSRRYRNSRDIEFYSNWVNRVYQSHLYFAEEILSSRRKRSRTVRLNTHDSDSSPWRTFSADRCTDSDAYQQWEALFEAQSATTQLRADYVLSAEGQDALNTFVSEGGFSASNTPVNWLFYWYCSAVDVPLSEETFIKVNNYWVTYENLFDDSEEEIELQYCFEHNMNLPAYYEVRERLLNALDDENAPRAYLVGSQSFSTRKFLQGLKLFFDGEDYVRKVRMNEMITLEVYSADDNDENIDYYFRFTRNGEFLRYHLCNDYYDDNNTELCDLNILLNGDFADATDYRNWEENVCSNFINDCVCGLC